MIGPFQIDPNQTIAGYIADLARKHVASKT